MSYRLFAFDLDGTLLSPDGTICPESKAFLSEIRAEARITLATGRSLAASQRYIQELAITDPVILYHGAVVWDPVGREPLLERRIPEVEARRALAVLARLPVHVQAYAAVEDPTVYVARVTPPIAQFLAKEHLPVVEVRDLERFLPRWPIKLLAIGEPDAVAAAEHTLRAALPTLTVVRSEATYVEVLPLGVSKGEGLGWLCTRLGIGWEDVVAVGDQMSDLSMIERAGLGVAMAHAPAPVREKADLVVDRVEKILNALGPATERRGIRCRSSSA